MPGAAGAEGWSEAEGKWVICLKDFNGFSEFFNDFGCFLKVFHDFKELGVKLLRFFLVVICFSAVFFKGDLRILVAFNVPTPHPNTKKAVKGVHGTRWP